MVTSSAEEFSPSLGQTRDRRSNKLRAAFLVGTAFSAITGTGTVASGPEVTNLVRFVASNGTSGGRIAGMAKFKAAPSNDGDESGLEDTTGLRLLDPGSVAVPDQIELVRWVHDASGLTWDQVGRLLGVSRRSVHMWANGGRINATNAEALNALAALIQATPPGTPDQRRAFLLAPRSGGRSALDEFRAARAGGHEMNASTFKPDELIGAIHDDQTTVSGRE
jgi:hypothetical protein